MRAVDSTTEAGVTAARTQEEPQEPDESYDELIAIAREHGPEEIKHLTRAYQAIAPAGGGKMIDLTALVDGKVSADQR